MTYCRNVTDVDDKILRAAAAEDIPWWALAERNARAFTDAYELLGCRPPDVEPRATGHIPDMIALIERLIDERPRLPAGGDVYFDVRTAAGLRLAVRAATRPRCARPRIADPERPAAAAVKRDPRDFALWKGAKPGEPSWRTPWGPGRPGWHLECSAMATGYLGAAFDIHGGGLDLVFPHHENERAQSTAAGDEFARYWVHNGLVALAGQKMSKSAGHALAAADALPRVRPQELRYYLGQAHYRSTIEYSRDALDDAVAAYQRIERFVSRAQHAVISGTGTRRICSTARRRAPAALPISFAAAMDDDLGVPSALAAVHATVHDGNYALSTGNIESTGPAWRRRGPCSRSSASTRSTPPGRPAIRTAGCTRWWTRWSRSCCDSGKRRGRGATMLRRTPSGTAWRTPGWLSRTPRRAPDGNLTR